MKRILVVLTILIIIVTGIYSLLSTKLNIPQRAKNGVLVFSDALNTPKVHMQSDYDNTIYYGDYGPWGEGKEAIFSMYFCNNGVCTNKQICLTSEIDKNISQKLIQIKSHQTIKDTTLLKNTRGYRFDTPNLCYDYTVLSDYNMNFDMAANACIKTYNLHQSAISEHYKTKPACKSLPVPSSKFEVMKENYQAGYIQGTDFFIDAESGDLLLQSEVRYSQINTDCSEIMALCRVDKNYMVKELFIDVSNRVSID